VGSYRLGVVRPDGGIDALCVGPPQVGREAFFTALAEKLKGLQSVTECAPIPDAFTPIIKLKMRGVGIDLLFARLAKPLEEGQSLEEALKDDQILKDMDDRSIRCINCYRVADQILQLVPNQDTFRSTLRFVKCWAQRRGIYSNVLGFFGGVTWAVLAARVCQLYPNYVPSQLVNRFFRTYDQWNWSKPVMLCEIVEASAAPGMAKFKVWNPRTNPADRQHVMPVITPAFPAMNSTHNVTETTKRILLDEFRRGYEVVKGAEAQKSSWMEVHEPFPFFQTFHQYLCLEILAKSEEVYHKLGGWVESKLRALTKQLDVYDGGSISGLVVRPNPERYDLGGTDADWRLGCGIFFALSFFKDQGAFLSQTVDLRPALSQFVDVISQWSEKDSYVGQFLIRMRRVPTSSLPRYALEAEANRKRLRAPQASPAREAKKART